jgi:CBS domain-containing protein/ferritin-like metal-binding protein YciE
MLTNHERLIRYLNNAWAVEKSLTSSLKDAAEKVDAADVRAHLLDQHARAHAAEENLEARIRALGEEPSGGKGFLSRVLAQIGDVLHEVDDEYDAATQALLKAYGSEHFACAMYEALAAYAESIGEAETEQLARRHQKQAREAAKKVWPLLGEIAVRAADEPEAALEGEPSIEKANSRRAAASDAAQRDTSPHGVLFSQEVTAPTLALRDVMTPDVEVIHPDATLQEAARKMKAMDVGPLPVAEDGRLVGILTDRDITIRATADGLDPTATLVREIMTPDVIYCFEDGGIYEAARLMEQYQVRRLPVVNQERQLLGIVSLGDIAVQSGHPRLTGEVLAKVSEPSEPEG